LRATTAASRLADATTLNYSFPPIGRRMSEASSSTCGGPGSGIAPVTGRY